MRRGRFAPALLLDAVVALVAAGLLVLLAPGFAVVGLVALVVLLVVVLSFVVELGIRRRRHRRSSREPPRARPPFRGVD